MVSVNTIDLSHFQSPESFDYQAAKKAGIQSIIIRGSTALSLDDHAKEHIANAKKYGFHWHLYHDWEGNDGEADFAVKAAKQLGLSSDQYLFFDMEGTHSGNWSDIFEDFRSKATTDFKVGLYISESPYKERFDDSKLQSEGVARWIANYSQEPAHYDIWQKSGAGSGGFGTYTGDVDRDVDKNNILVGGSSPLTPTEPKKTQYTQIVLEPGYDTDSGEYGRGYSNNNGKTFHVTDTTYGRKYRQEDGDRIAPFLKKYFSPAGPVETTIHWAAILDKPDLVTESGLESKLSQYKPTAVSNTVTTITSGTLADLASKTGVYHYEIDFIPSDSPTHDGGLLDVVVGANYAKQVFTSTANSDVYVRTRKQGVWSAWRQVTLWN